MIEESAGWISPQHYEYADTERRLIDLFHELGGQVAATAKEYFAGLSFSAVTAKAARWRYITPGPAEPAPGVAIEHARKNLAFLASLAVDGRTTIVTSHGRPYFAIAPAGSAFMPDLTGLDQRLRDAINAGNDQALTELADEIEQAGLPLLALNVRTRKSAGLRAALTSLPGSAT